MIFSGLAKLETESRSREGAASAAGAAVEVEVRGAAVEERLEYHVGVNI